MNTNALTVEQIQNLIDAKSAESRAAWWRGFHARNANNIVAAAAADAEVDRLNREIDGLRAERRAFQTYDGNCYAAAQ